MTEADYRACLTATGVPAHVHDGYVLYLCHHLRPGHFLQAVLSNDLKEACARGDEPNLAALANHVRFLYQFAPLESWGSPEMMRQWLNQVEPS